MKKFGIIFLFLGLLFLFGCNKTNIAVSNTNFSKSDDIEDTSIILESESNKLSDLNETTENTIEETFENYYTNKKGDNKIVVAYFSLSGNTEKVAKDIEDFYYKKNKKVDVYRIEPKINYDIENDFDLNNENCRYNIEKSSDEKIELLDYNFNIKDHSYIFLGFPIWYGSCPKIVLDFLKSYDFNNKVIIPFSTSDNSPYGNINDELKEILTCEMRDGIRFAVKYDKNEVLEWLKKENIQ